MTQHMAGMNVYNTNSMVGYSSQHMGGSTTPSSAHMTVHIWKWSHFSKKRCNANNPGKRGKLSCRNQWIRLSLRHFVMQGRRRKRRRRRAKKNKVWENHYYLSFSSLPMLSLLVSVHGHVFAYFHACLQNIFLWWPIQQGSDFHWLELHIFLRTEPLIRVCVRTHLLYVGVNC